MTKTTPGARRQTAVDDCPCRACYGLTYEDPCTRSLEQHIDTLLDAKLIGEHRLALAMDGHTTDPHTGRPLDAVKLHAAVQQIESRLIRESDPVLYLDEVLPDVRRRCCYDHGSPR